MSRKWTALAGAIGLSLLLAACSGGDDEEPADGGQAEVEADAGDGAAADNGGAEAGAVEEGLAAFAAAIGAEGVTLAFGDVSVDGVVSDLAVMAGDAFGWRATSATVSSANGDGIALSAVSDVQILIGDEAGAIGISAESAELTRTPAAGGVEIAQSGVVMIAPGEGTEIGQLTLTFADTASRWTARDITLPAENDTPFGHEMFAVAADVAPNGDGGGATLTNLVVQWGVLDFEAAGPLTLSAGSGLSGTTEASFYDVLMMLDAYNVTAPFDHEAMGEAYAALVLDVDPDRDQPTAVSVGFENGDLIVLGDDRGAPDLRLEGVMLGGWAGAD